MTAEARRDESTDGKVMHAAIQSGDRQEITRYRDRYLMYFHREQYFSDRNKLRRVGLAEAPLDDPMSWTMVGDDLAKSAPHRWWVAEHTGRVVGFAGIGPSRDPVGARLGELDTIAVDPSYWRLGIGQTLASLAFRRLVADGYDEAVVWTVEGHELGIGFYEAMGWKHDGGVRDNGRQIRLRRSLEKFRLPLSRMGNRKRQYFWRGDEMREETPAVCGLCAPSLGPIVIESAFWKLIVNLNQNLLGKCFLTLNRHEESVSDLSETEWLDLHRQLKRTTKALTEAFAPSHFNYAFLQNQDKHVHFHVIPRFAAPREFAGCQFGDPDFPGHYSVPSPRNLVSVDVLEKVADEIRSSDA